MVSLYLALTAFLLFCLLVCFYSAGRARSRQIHHDKYSRQDGLWIWTFRGAYQLPAADQGAIPLHNLENRQMANREANDSFGEAPWLLEQLRYYFLRIMS
jgi:hypothetical protein